MQNVQCFTMNTKEVSTTHYIKLGDLLLTWFREVTASGVNADEKVREKADDIALLLGVENVQASGG